MAHAPTHHRLRPRTPWAAAIAVAAIVALAAPAHAQSPVGCTEDGYNMQCTEFGQIRMENQRDIRGEPIDVTIDVRIDETYERAGARWIMFSIRHDAGSGPSPVSLEMTEFAGPHGDIYTTRVDHDVPSEINVWVHVVDIPVGSPLTMKVNVGVADRGAFKLETLVMPFDRGYEPLRTPTGEDRSLYAATLLGVNQETGGDGGGGGSPFGDGLRTPGPALPLAAVALLGVAAVVARRRNA